MAGRARGSSKPADVSGETAELLRGRDGASPDEEAGVTTRRGRPRHAPNDLEWSWAFVASYAAFCALVVVGVPGVLGQYLQGGRLGHRVREAPRAVEICAKAAPTASASASADRSRASPAPPEPAAASPAPPEPAAAAAAPKVDCESSIGDRRKGLYQQYNRACARSSEGVPAGCAHARVSVLRHREEAGTAPARCDAWVCDTHGVTGCHGVKRDLKKEKVKAGVGDCEADVGNMNAGRFAYVDGTAPSTRVSRRRVPDPRERTVPVLPVEGRDPDDGLAHVSARGVQEMGDGRREVLLSTSELGESVE